MIINLAAKQAERKETENIEHLKEWFIDTFCDQPQSFLVDLLDALQAGDMERYLALTEPIIRRKAIYEANTTS